MFDIVQNKPFEGWAQNLGSRLSHSSEVHPPSVYPHQLPNPNRHGKNPQNRSGFTGTASWGENPVNSPQNPTLLGCQGGGRAPHPKSPPPSSPQSWNGKKLPLLINDNKKKKKKKTTFKKWFKRISGKKIPPELFLS